jgi:D-amino-acid dehydrogenase
VTLYRDGRMADPNALGWRLRRERGAELRLISQEELREIEPDLSPDYEAAIVMQGQGRTTNPQRLLTVLTERMLAQGGKMTRAEVGAIRPDAEGVALEGGMGSRRVGRVVVAAGAWSAHLLKSMGLRVPLETERGYHLTIRDPGVTINNTIMEAGRMVVASSMQDGLRLAGTVELAGLKPAPDYRRSRMLETLGRAMFPGLRPGEASEWMGHRPSLPDSLPVIGHAPGHRNVLLAFGHSHLGLSGGAPTGRLIAQLAAGETPAIELSPFRLDRF